MSTKEETAVTGTAKLIALSAAVGLGSIAEFTAWIDLFTKIILGAYAVSLFGLLWWKNFWRGYAESKGWLDKYPWLKGKREVLDPRETEPAPLPTLPKS